MNFFYRSTCIMDRCMAICFLMLSNEFPQLSLLSETNTNAPKVQTIHKYLFVFVTRKKIILYHENEKSNMSRLWVNMFVYFWRGVFFCWKIVGLAVVDIDASFYRKVSFIRSQTWYYCENLYFLVFTENSNLFHLQYIRIMFEKYVSF